METEVVTAAGPKTPAKVKNLAGMLEKANEKIAQLEKAQKLAAKPKPAG